MEPFFSFTFNTFDDNNTIIISENEAYIELNNEFNLEFKGFKDFNNKSFKLNNKNSDIYII